MYTMLDLRPYFDQRMTHADDLTEEERKHKILGNCFLEKSFSYGVVEAEGVPYRLDRGEFGCDCVLCQGNRIAVDPLPCRRVHAAGISFWGYFEEDCRLTFDDGSSGILRLDYADWAFPVFRNPDLHFDVDRETLAAASNVLCGPLPVNDDIIPNGYIYRVSSAEWATKRLVEIQLPDNILMLVYGLTVEG